MIADWLTRRADWQLALITGGLIGLSYPPLPLGFLAWIGLVPLLIVLLRSSSRSALKWSFIAASFSNLISLYWIGFNSGATIGPVLLSLTGAIIYLALFWMAWGYLVSWAERTGGLGLYVAPFAFVTMEFVRGFGPLGFPWLNLALTQTQFLPLVQMADITGTLGISFWLLMINVGFYLIVFKREQQRVGVILISGLFLAAWLYGVIRINHLSTGEPLPEENVYRVAVVQPNMDPNEKWDREYRRRNFALMDSLLNVGLDMHPDFVLWPETAVPAYLRLQYSVRRPLQQKVNQTGIPLLSGTVDRIIEEDGTKRYYNATIFLKPDAQPKMYYKVFLVPFAEYIPLSETFPVLKKLNFGQGNFNQGSEYTVFAVDSIRFSNVICYESSLPQVVRRFIQNGAQFMTIEANDGYIQGTNGPEQHFELARLRAIENRVPIVRSANTGISGLILPTGEVDTKIPQGVKTVFMATFSIPEKTAFYTRYGDSFALLITVSLFSITGWIWIQNKRQNI